MHSHDVQSVQVLPHSDNWSVTCSDRLAERYFRILALYDQKPADPTRGVPGMVEDLVAGFYYRTLQIEMPVIHVCKLGYCKTSWKSPCKRNLPTTQIEPQQRFDETLQRVIAQKRHLEDDARVLTHSVPLLARTLMNIQINQHHPNDAHGGLNYQVKYNLKPEPQTVVQLGCASDHEAVRYLKGQFLSVSAAASFVLEDPITECTRNNSPLALPSWKVGHSDDVQGRWRRYCCRLPYREEETSLGRARFGYHLQLSDAEVFLAILFAPFLSFARYFGDARDEKLAAGAAVSAGEKTKDSEKGIHPTRLFRAPTGNWDHVADDYRHPQFNIVISNLLPGEKFIPLQGSLTTDAYRKLRNGKLQFPRFWEYDLSTKKDIDGTPSRTHHFRIRLFKVLPAVSLDSEEVVLATPLTCITEGMKCNPWVTFNTLGSRVKNRPPQWDDVRGIVVVAPKSREDFNTNHDAPEQVCRYLEEVFVQSDALCECCMRSKELRCNWSSFVLLFMHALPQPRS